MFQAFTSCHRELFLNFGNRSRNPPLTVTRIRKYLYNIHMLNFDLQIVLDRSVVCTIWSDSNIHMLNFDPQIVLDRSVVCTIWSDSNTRMLNFDPRIVLDQSVVCTVWSYSNNLCSRL